jgi:purine-nucleoside phosphorylase
MPLMTESLLPSHVYDEAAAAVRDRTDADLAPDVGVILGSGLSALADAVESSRTVPYTELPHFPVSTVEGHSGRLVSGRLGGRSVVVLQGRAHYYEGYSQQQITLPVRVLHRLGVRTLIVTNAAGGLNPAFEPGDLMLISDHINLVGMAGAHPLRGPNDPTFGPRFPDMSRAYDPSLRALAQQVGQAQGLPLREGVYACVAGPSFETPAEVRFLRLIGADAVGMSTASEVTVARHAGMRVLGVSGISNVAVSMASTEQKTTHAEVLEAGKIIAPRLVGLVTAVLAALPDAEPS